MPRLSADQWETIRAEREAGASFPELAAKYGVSHQAIQKRAKAEGWGDGQDVGEIVRRKVAEKVAGVVAACNPKKRAEAINAAAERSAEIIKRHQEESSEIRERLYAGLKAHRAAETKEQKQLAFEDLKAAKIASETLLNIHRAERQAWGLDEERSRADVVIHWDGDE
ncbi:hypothetical protein LCC91_07760 [Tepidimonas taiwanensis]|uniref:Uncharacterized protein n=1 Tax=Tepidimonas taiwanensis TaxID=307486 RepID=A0A554XAZ0_9BURK|nr:hypothetical protein [Tepidimonas taiwanensis]TSE32994.1 hypothetical protein Ttaiw_00855 [Tepidimonas taiwanensis]UBQ04470.1 hypothetical protein LCC91_07760 [Tepidimonas taiwanensis]